MIPTPNGFSQLSSLHSGDTIFGRDGKPYAILAESELVTAPAYRLTFDDGSELIAHDDHKWLTFNARELTALTRKDDAWRLARREKRLSRSCVGAGTKWNHTAEHRQFLSAAISERNHLTAQSKRTTSPSGTVRTTAEIVATLRTKRGRANHAIPVADALDLSEKSLPLDPYVLGVWLGDGTTLSGEVTTADPEITSAVEAAGFPVKSICKKDNCLAVTVRHHNLRATLKSMGLLGNKNIPHDYLWASKDQRLALLQGLMDTDGGIGSGSAEFTSTKKCLAEGVAHLARSLGHKAAIREGVAKLNGRVIGPKWTVKFAAKLQVFRLPRKANRLVLATRRTTKFRYIIKAERIDPVEMKCLRVASPDNLFLAGEHLIPTHNSVALLAAALQFVSVPGYSALLLRRSFADLNLPKALIPLSHLFLQETDATWDGQKYRWTFPSGATLSFGYLATDVDKFRYQGAEFSFIGFDELTQFTESQYSYLRSRLRKPASLNVPLRVRSASNPGGVGHLWVKARFIDPKTRGNRLFVPAKLEDNPHLDQPSYEESLNELDPITRKQLRHGDWNVTSDDGIFKSDWFRRYGDEGEFYRLTNAQGATWLVKKSDCRKYATMDVAASERTQADWSVLQLWALTPSYDMLLIDQWRGQNQIPDVVATVARKCWEWDVEFLGVEKDGIGLAAVQTLRERGVTVKALSTGGKDKIKRATAATIRMEAGTVFFPKRADWLEQAIEEILIFPNAGNGGHDDVVDALAWAAYLAQRLGGAPRSTEADQAIEQKEQQQSDALESSAHPGSQIAVEAVAAGAGDVDDFDRKWLAGE